jgi:hypothetical protein
MHASSIAKAASATLAGGGLALAAGAAAFGAQSPYREMLIVAGIDGLAIGLAAFVLVMIFRSAKPSDPQVLLATRKRSLDSPEGNELKHMLMRVVSSDKPVTIGFAPDDPEARRFAGQIGQFLHEQSFKIIDFAAAPPTVQLDPGIGIDEGNHILVGPIDSRATNAPVAGPAEPAAHHQDDQATAQAMQAAGAHAS